MLRAICMWIQQMKRDFAQIFQWHACNSSEQTKWIITIQYKFLSTGFSIRIPKSKQSNGAVIFHKLEILFQRSIVFVCGIVWCMRHHWNFMQSKNTFIISRIGCRPNAKHKCAQDLITSRRAYSMQYYLNYSNISKCSYIFMCCLCIETQSSSCF